MAQINNPSDTLKLYLTLDKIDLSNLKFIANSLGIEDQILDKENEKYNIIKHIAEELKKLNKDEFKNYEDIIINIINEKQTSNLLSNYQKNKKNKKRTYIESIKDNPDLLMQD